MKRINKRHKHIHKSQFPLCAWHATQLQHSGTTAKSENKHRNNRAFNEHQTVKHRENTEVAYMTYFDSVIFFDENYRFCLFSHFQVGWTWSCSFEFTKPIDNARKRVRVHFVGMDFKYSTENNMIRLEGEIVSVSLFSG